MLKYMKVGGVGQFMNDQGKIMEELLLSLMDFGLCVSVCPEASDSC